MATLDDMQQLKQSLEQISTNPNNIRAQLFFILKESSTTPAQFSVYKALHTNSLSEDFLKIFKDTLDEFVEKQTPLVPYDINLDTNETYQYISVANIPNASIINDRIFNDANTDILEDVDNSVVQKIWAYAVKISFGSEEIIYYKKYSKGKVMRKGFFNAIAFNGGRFSRIEESIFQIPNGVDAFLYRNEIIIFQLVNFERIFGYEDVYENAAQVALNQISVTHSYADIAQLTTFVSTDGRKKRKLAAILGNGLIPHMGFNEVSTTIQRYNLDIRIDQTNQKFNLTAQNTLTFLKALNDDYLRSEITSTRYEASSKRRT